MYRAFLNLIPCMLIYIYIVGATLCKSLNRGLATLLAGALGVGAQHLASLFAEREEPIVLGILVFLLGIHTTYYLFYFAAYIHIQINMYICILIWCDV